MGEIWDLLPGLGDKLAAHVVLSASAIGLAMLIAFALLSFNLAQAVWRYWRARRRTVAEV